MNRKIINVIALTAIIISIIITSTTSVNVVKAQGLDSMITDLKNQENVLVVQIVTTNLTGTNQVQNLINKVYYYQGEISAMGGGTWSYLHDVQDTLLSKIKATGKSGFTVPELAAIDAFTSEVIKSKQEHPTVNAFS
jgi:hypothetical protein